MGTPLPGRCLYASTSIIWEETNSSGNHCWPVSSCLSSTIGRKRNAGTPPLGRVLYARDSAFVNARKESEDHCCSIFPLNGSILDRNKKHRDTSAGQILFCQQLDHWKEHGEHRDTTAGSVSLPVTRSLEGKRKLQDTTANQFRFLSTGTDSIGTRLLVRRLHASKSIIWKENGQHRDTTAGPFL